MRKIAFYRKYRPQNFENLIGQDHVKTTLQNAFKSGHIAHAYLFSGPRGTGKTSTARLIAKALNCENLKDGFDPCDSCEFCKEINENRLIDIIEIDAASNRGIDEVRDLKEKIRFAPSRAKYKVYIIDEVHMMTKEAFNALLKTLEEPPDHAYFILATTEIHKIPDTIISRCQRFDFRRISQSDLQKRLQDIAEKEEVEADEQSLLAIAKYAKGGLRDAIGLLEQLQHGKKLEFVHVKEILGVSDTGLLEELYAGVLANRTNEALAVIGKIYDQGSNLRHFIEEFVEMLREKMLKMVEAGKDGELGRALEMIEVFQEALHKPMMVIPQLPFEMAIVKLTKDVEEVAVKPVPKEEAPEAKPRQHQPVQKKEVAKPVEIEAKPEVAATAVAGDLNWNEAIMNIKNPTLRMSLKNAVFGGVVENEVVLEFDSKFHKDKVMEHDHRVELEEFLKGAFKKEVKVRSELKKLEMKPSFTPVVEQAAPTPVAQEPVKEKKDLTDEAMNIFGGELV